MSTVLDTLGSAAFTVTLVALLRKEFPKIDGRYVTAVYVILACAVALLTHYSAAIPPSVWTALQVVAGVIAGTGAVTLGQQIAAKGGKTTTVRVSQGSPVTISTEPLDRDTTPNAP